ncbi:hypothetical protein RRG08_025172 [Elysia crispata]|uniref:Uncharacterized protein n=1 Tax=Elysia crispata TaxID=231223 RepID=A0AAE1DD66_9GAST|nr:hypothetical protein RRG08_025172 [Elysia crispata]
MILLQETPTKSRNLVRKIKAPNNIKSVKDANWVQLSLVVYEKDAKAMEIRNVGQFKYDEISGQLLVIQESSDVQSLGKSDFSDRREVQLTNGLSGALLYRERRREAPRDGTGQDLGEQHNRVVIGGAEGLGDLPDPGNGCEGVMA